MKIGILILNRKYNKMFLFNWKRYCVFKDRLDNRIEVAVVYFEAAAILFYCQLSFCFPFPFEAFFFFYWAYGLLPFKMHSLTHQIFIDLLKWRTNGSSKKDSIMSLKPLKTWWCNKKSPENNKLKVALTFRFPMRIFLLNCLLEKMLFTTIMLLLQTKLKLMTLDFLNMRILYNKFWSNQFEIKRDSRLKNS